MNKYIFAFIAFAFLCIIISPKVDAFFCCNASVGNPIRVCIESPSCGPNQFNSYKDCLNGGNPPNPALACVDDPRYQLRNFAPFLSFPNIGSILNLSTALVATFGGLFCMIVMFGGVWSYLHAGGDPKKIESARNKMVYAGIGLLVVLFAYTIVRVILDATNTNTIGF